MNDTSARSAASTTTRDDHSKWHKVTALVQLPNEGADRTERDGFQLESQDAFLSALKQIEDEERALDHLFDHVEDLLQGRRFGDCVLLLRSAEPTELSPALGVAVLSSLVVARPELSNDHWARYRERLAATLQERDFPAERIAALLQPFR